MEITKTVPVTIEIDDDNKRDCSDGCCFNVEGRYCARFDVTTINGRNDGCLSEFGTGEKPNVVPWEESKVGDVVDFNGRMALIGLPPFVEDVCAECYMFVDGICRAVRRGVPLCTEHHSGHRVFFNKPGESK
jgi:hypothetical protein